MTPQEIAQNMKEACLNAAVTAEKIESSEMGLVAETRHSQILGLLMMLEAAVKGWKTELTGKLPKFKTFEYADVSTAYLTEHDWELMSDADVPGHIAKVDGGLGDFYHTCSDDPKKFAELYVPAWKKVGLSGRFIEIMVRLHEQKIPYVRFDADGNDIEGMEHAS